MMIQLKSRQRPHPLRAKLAKAKLDNSKAARTAASQRTRLALPFQPHWSASARRWSNRLTRFVLIIGAGLLLLNLVRCAAPLIGAAS